MEKVKKKLRDMRDGKGVAQNAPLLNARMCSISDLKAREGMTSERRLITTSKELIIAKNKITPVEKENAHLKKKLSVSRKAYALLGQDKEEKKKFEADLKAKDAEITNIGFKIRELELIRASDKTSLLTEFKETPELTQIMIDRNSSHMDSLKKVSKLSVKRISRSSNLMKTTPP
ncbi:hypothetical protein U1Q18_016463 [Sarracenia purpurea var. burkii]